MMHGMPQLGPIPIVDTWRIAKYKLKLRNNRLDTLARAIHVPEGKIRAEKTPLEPWIWVKAHTGDKTSIKYIEEHCIADIDVLEAVYTQVRRLDLSHPNISKIETRTREACPTCDSNNVQFRGTFPTVRGRKYRFHCQDCGHWSSRSASK